VSVALTRQAVTLLVISNPSVPSYRCSSESYASSVSATSLEVVWSKELSEFRNHFVASKRVATADSLTGGDALPQPTLFERYVGGSVNFHLHALFHVRRHVRDYDVCAAVQRSLQSEHPQPLATCVDRKLPASSERVRQIGSTVFVTVREGIQDRQGVLRWRSIDSSMRLQSIDDCFRALGQPFEDGVPLCGVVTRIGECGERPTATVAGRIRDSNEGADQIIQRGAHVVDSVTEQDSQPDGGFSVDGIREASYAVFFIDVHPDVVCTTVQVSADLAVIRCKVLISRDDFGVDTL
jgi:hypothetical protein